MNCPACRQDNPTDSVFCESCGATLEASCPSCGASASPSANFCRKCGHALTGEGEAPAEPRGRAGFGSAGASPSQSSPPSQDRLPRDYTPKHLAEKILTSKSALEGERKQVTVLFADVKGSMDLAEQVDPEEWHRILNRFFEILSDGVHRFEGTVNQYTGDGIMALFGAPITHEDHAHRACYAALHLQDELRLYSEELKRTKGLNFAARMGLNSGEVVVGKIGDDLRMDYTAQGHTVGLAQRMESLADSGKAYVSANTAELISGFFKLRDLGEFELKGVSKPLHVFELEGVGEMRTRLDVSRARGLSGFVGRSDEMASLERAFKHAAEGNGQVIGVVAEAGIGKSRLCYEFVERRRAEGLSVNESHCVAHGKEIPFLPMLEMLRGYFGYTEKDSGKEIREKIAGKLLLLDDRFKEGLPVLFDFIGVPDPDRPAPRMDPEALQRQLFGLIKQLLQAESRREAGVLLIEDLHWIDQGSELFLEALIDALPGTRGILLVNFRPEYQAAWMQKSYYQRLALLPLGPDAIREMLDQMLGVHASLAGLAERIADRTAGNPFFIEEVIRTLADSDVLEGTRGAYRLAGPIEDVAIPATVQSLLGARIDRLPEQEKKVLQSASVIGKEFTEPVLRRVTDLPDPQLEDSLRQLIASEFIHEEALYPEREYAFKHPLTQEVAYKSQLGDRRANTHAAVGRAIADLYPDKLDERAALLAHHFESAGDVLEASRWHHRASEWAGVRDPAAALQHARRIRSLLEGTGESPETTGLGLAARIQSMIFGIRMGLTEEEVQNIFLEGKALAERGENIHALHILTVFYAATKVSAGPVAEGLELGREALRLAEQAGDETLVRGAHSLLMFAYHQMGRLHDALACSDPAIAHPPADPKQGIEFVGFSPYFQILNLRVLALSSLGRIREATSERNRLVELCKKYDETEVLGWVLGNCTFISFVTGETDSAIPHAREAFQIAEGIGSALSRTLAHLSLGFAYLLNERWSEANDLLEKSLILLRGNRSGLFIEPLLLSYLAECQIHVGSPSRALELADEAVAVSERRGEDLNLQTTHLTRARVLLETGRAKAPEEITTSLDTAMAFCVETGMKSLVPFIHEERAKLARLQGDEAARRQELEAARRIFEEMECPIQVDRLTVELGEDA